MYKLSVYQIKYFVFRWLSKYEPFLNPMGLHVRYSDTVKTDQLFVAANNWVNFIYSATYMSASQNYFACMFDDFL